MFLNKLVIQLSYFQISSFHGNQWLLPLKVAPVAMVPYKFRPLYVTLTFSLITAVIVLINVINNNAFGFKFVFVVYRYDSQYFFTHLT